MSPLPQSEDNMLISGLDKSMAVMISQMADVREDVKEIKVKLEGEYAKSCGEVQTTVNPRMSE